MGNRCRVSACPFFLGQERKRCLWLAGYELHERDFLAYHPCLDQAKDLTFPAAKKRLLPVGTRLPASPTDDNAGAGMRYLRPLECSMLRQRTLFCAHQPSLPPISPLTLSVSRTFLFSSLCQKDKTLFARDGDLPLFIAGFDL